MKPEENPRQAVKQWQPSFIIGKITHVQSVRATMAFLIGETKRHFTDTALPSLTCLKLRSKFGSNAADSLKAILKIIQMEQPTFKELLTGVTLLI
jgi:hypothetical protein